MLTSFPSGWLHLRAEHTYYHPPSTEMDTAEPPVWPPKFTKFSFTTDGTPAVEGAFTDPRRFSRVRLLKCPAASIRSISPLKENGPDPLIDAAILTPSWLTTKLSTRHVPIKALLLDQSTISGVGNWVGDEVLYHAGIHPEQYSDTLSQAQVNTLHEKLMYVCQTAVGVLAASDKFPEEWLFKHRWNKGKKGGEAGKMPGGEKIVWLTVGGRTSAVVPSKQKKTGAVAGEVKTEDNEGKDDEPEDKPKTKGKKRKIEAEEKPSDGGKVKKPKSKGKVKDESEVEEEKPKSAPVKEKNTTANTKAKRSTASASGQTDLKETGDGRRRSGRVKT